MCKSNILVLTLVSITLNNVVSSNILAALNTDLNNTVSMDYLNISHSSAHVTCSPGREPVSFTSKCCGNRYVKKDDRRKRSVGSEGASSTEYPWVAFLEYPDKAVCTGILISKVHVLTAAHCIVDVRNKPTSVRLGHHGKAARVICSNSAEGRTCNDGAISIPIENITVHSHYNMSKTWNNDIAIIKLNKSVHYSEYIQPICLPTFEVTEKSVPGVVYEVAGWGTTFQINLSGLFYINQEIGTKLTKVENIPYKSNNVCQKLYDTKVKGKYTIRDTHICAGGVEGHGPCSGDSGGPLMYKKDNRYTAVGIVSFTTVGPCAQEDVPAVYTNIYKYKHWIREHTSENNNTIIKVDDNSTVSLNNITTEQNFDKKIFHNVTSNHGTVLTSVTRPLIVILYCLCYVLI